MTDHLREQGTPPSQPGGGGPSAGLAFGVALVSLLISGTLFFQTQSLRVKLNRQLEENSFHLHRTAALLEALGISLEPGPGYEGLDLEWPPPIPMTDAGRALDESKMAVAMGQLRNIRTALVMNMVEGDRSRYPATSQIRTYADLREILSDHAFLPDDPLEKGWIFLGYLRPATDTFLLITEARNRARTLIFVTPEQITPLHVAP